MNSKHKCPICNGKSKKSLSKSNGFYLNNQNIVDNSQLISSISYGKERNISGIQMFLQILLKVISFFKINKNIPKIIVILLGFIILTMLIHILVDFEMMEYRKPLARLNWVPNTENWWSNAIMNSQNECQKYASINSLLMKQLTSFEEKIAELESKLIDKHSIKKIVNEHLNKYDADKLGITDFALSSAGARIISTPNTYPWPKQTWLNILSFWTEPPKVPGPNAILEPGTNVGECWAFQGDQGNVLIQLVGQVWIGAVTMEHISSSISIDGSINTAPRQFTIKGFQNSSCCNGRMLGEFEYLNNGVSRQTFVLSQEFLDLGPFEFIELSIQSNHGHPQYTCVYRLRVHGKLAE